MKQLIVGMLLLMVAGCSQQENGGSTQPAPQATTKTLSLTLNGIDEIKIGKSNIEIGKVLNDNNISINNMENTNGGTFSASGFIRTMVSGFIIENLRLRFEQLKLKEIDGYTSDALWDDNLVMLDKVSNELTALYGPGKQVDIPNKKVLVYKQEQLITTWPAGSNNQVSLSIRDVNSTLYKCSLKIAANPAPDAVITLTKAGKRVQSKHPTWDIDTCNAVGAGNINIGMTKEQVSAAWGRPQSINTTTTAYSSSEQWVYGLKNYVYFDGDTCTTIQN